MDDREVGVEERVQAALQAHPRQGFLPPGERGSAGLDRPLPIGHGQTNSQPTTVRLLLGWLDARPGQRVLDVGAGSGWTTALLAHLVGQAGHVHAVERVPELLELGRSHCTDVPNCSFHAARHGVLGLPAHAPFDRVLVSAAADELPAALVAQVARGGRLVVPVRHEVQVVDVDADGEPSVVVHRGFRFVPLVE